MTKRKAEKLAKECVRYYLEEYVQIIPQHPKSMYAFDLFIGRKTHYFIVGCRPVMDRLFIVVCTDNSVSFIELKTAYNYQTIDLKEFKEWKNDKSRSEIYRQKIW